MQRSAREGGEDENGKEKCGRNAEVEEVAEAYPDGYRSQSTPEGGVNAARHADGTWIFGATGELADREGQVYSTTPCSN